VFLLASALAALFLARRFSGRVLYFVVPWACLQNFLLAWIYSAGLAGKGFCQALLLFKEFVLMGLFLLYLPQVLRRGCSLPVRLAGLFTAWCCLRYLAAVVIQGENFIANLWNLRVISFPLQILVVGIGATINDRRFALRFIRRMTLWIAAIAAVGLGLYFLTAPDFWRDQVNIARYNAEVKGESEDDGAIRQQLSGADSLEQAEGLPGNARGREEFSLLFRFRAIGTVGDAVGFGHLLVLPMALLVFCHPVSWKTSAAFLLVSMALLFTFTRSAWIFVLVSAAYVLFRKGKQRTLIAGAAVVSAMFTLWPPFSDWFSGTMTLLSWSNPQEEHAEGLVWLYKEGLWHSANLLGQGLSAPVYESGYGILLVRYGLPAVLLALAFFCSRSRNCAEALSATLHCFWSLRPRLWPCS